MTKQIVLSYPWDVDTCSTSVLHCQQGLTATLLQDYFTFINLSKL